MAIESLAGRETLGAVGENLADDEKRAVLAENEEWAAGLMRRSARAASYLLQAKTEG